MAASTKYYNNKRLLAERAILHAYYTQYTRRTIYRIHCTTHTHNIILYIYILVCIIVTNVCRYTTNIINYTLINRPGQRGTP